MARHLVAAVQMTSGEDKTKNLSAADRLVENAARRGATFVALPELFNCLGEPETIVAQAEPIPGPTSRAMSALAARLEVTLLAGSFAERADESDKIFNTSVLFSPDGTELARYRKIHLFDIDLPGQVTFRESGFMASGARIAVTQTSVGRLGQAICYDLRFSELFRELIDAGAELFAVPAAFTLPTGRDHWEVLLRARAIENQVYVIAPNHFGRPTPSVSTCGRSIIVDPWGTVLATAPDGEAVIVAEIDTEYLATVRARLPALEHRRRTAGLPRGT